MEQHHDHHHSEGQKPVSFTVPLIMASVVIFIMVLLLSVCDPKHHGKCECKEDCSQECMDKCEKGDHSSHDEHGNELKGGASHGEASSHSEEHSSAQDTTHATHEHDAPVDSVSANHEH